MFSITLSAVLSSLLVFTLNIRHGVSSNMCKFDNGITGIQENGYYMETLTSLEKNPKEVAISHQSGNIYIIDYDDNLEKQLKVFVRRKNETFIKVWHEKIQTIAVDNFEEKVYLGFKSGLKLYDEIYDEIVDSVPEIKHDIQKLVVAKKNQLIIITSPNNVYTYDLTKPNKTIKPETFENKRILDLAVDFDGNRFIRTLDEQYKIELNILMNEMKYRYCPVQYTGNILFSNLASDNCGKVCGITDHGLYCLYSDTSTPEFVTSIDFTPGSAAPCFDKNNNLILVKITNTTEIVVLKPKNPKLY